MDPLTWSRDRWRCSRMKLILFFPVRLCGWAAWTRSKGTVDSGEIRGGSALKYARSARRGHARSRAPAGQRDRTHITPFFAAAVDVRFQFSHDTSDENFMGAHAASAVAQTPPPSSVVRAPRVSFLTVQPAPRTFTVRRRLRLNVSAAFRRILDCTPRSRWKVLRDRSGSPRADDCRGVGSLGTVKRSGFVDIILLRTLRGSPRFYEGFHGILDAIAGSSLGDDRGPELTGLFADR